MPFDSRSQDAVHSAWAPTDRAWTANLDCAATTIGYDSRLLDQWLISESSGEAPEARDAT
jgi:hypothetical protein